MSTTRGHGHSKNPIKCAPSTLLIQFSSIISIRLCHQLHITGSRLLLGVTFEAFQTHALSERCWSHYAQRIITDAHASRLSTQSTVNPSSIIIIGFGRPSHRNSPFAHTQLVTWLSYRLFPAQLLMDVQVVPCKDDGQDMRDFLSPGRSLVSMAFERSICRW